jgi:hypothetical protein
LWIVVINTVHAISVIGQLVERAEDKLMDQPCEQSADHPRRDPVHQDHQDARGIGSGAAGVDNTKS